jgi:hypothetical protein
VKFTTPSRDWDVLQQAKCMICFKNKQPTNQQTNKQQQKLNAYIHLSMGVHIKLLEN